MTVNTFGTRPRFRIGTRLFLLVLALAVPFAVYAVYTAFDDARLETDQAAVQMLAAARVTAARLDDHAGDVRQLLKVMTVLASVDPARTEDNDLLLLRLVGEIPEHVGNLTVWSTDGGNLGTIDPRIRASGPPNVANRKFFREAIAGSKLAFEGPVPSISDGQLIAIFALPILRQGQVAGVVAASVRVAALRGLLNDASLPKGSLVTVVSPGGRVLARTLDPERWVGKPVEAAAGADPNRSKRPREGTRIAATADGIERVGAFTTAPTTGWLVYVGMPKEAALRPVYEHLRNNLLTAAAVLLLGLVLAYAVGEGIASPLRRLSAEAMQLGDDGGVHAIRTRAHGEVGLLAERLDAMARRLHERTLALKANEEKLRQVTDNMPALISYLDRDQRFQFVNRRYAEWLGAEAESLIGKRLGDLYGEQTYQRFSHHIDQAMAGTPVVYERELQTLQGLRHVEVTAVPDFGEAGDVKGLYVLIHDVSPARKAQAEVVASKRQLQMIADNIPALIAYIDRDERFRFINVSGERAFGVAAAELMGRSCREVRGEALYAELAPHIAAALRGETVEFEGSWNLGRRLHHYRSTYVPDVDAEQGVLGYYAMTFDITALKETQRQLDQLARIDVLTGLANRREYTERLRTAMERSQRSQRLMALLFLDVDRFKSINDSHGHATGDAVLRELAARLSACTRVTDTVARLAGDEFVVIVENVATPAEIAVVADKIIEAIRRPMQLENVVLEVTCSLGYASYTGAGGDVESLTAKADEALYRAKKAGRDTCASTEFAALA